MKKAAKKSTKKAKKSFSLQEKLIMLICCVAITGSFTTIFTYAAATWNAPDNTDTVAMTDSGNELQGPGRESCCGTANKTYGCNENSFTSTTTTSTIGVFCKPPAVRSTFPKVINFPNPGETARWNCICKNADGTPIVGPDGKPVVSSCAASRKGPGTECGINNYKTLMVDRLPAMSDQKMPSNELCSKGYFVLSGSGLRRDTAHPNCEVFHYFCADNCTNKPFLEGECLVRFCTEIKDEYCKDRFLDPGEECETTVTGGGSGGFRFFGKTCANASTKGACGELKCTDSCKIDDSGCYPCPPISDGVFTD